MTTPPDASPPAPAIAVIGGGQLARMMAPPAAQLGIPRRLLAEGPGFSAAQVIGESLGLGDLVDYSGDRPWDGFDSIQVVTLRSAASNTPGIAGGEASYTIDGDVRVEGGTTYSVQFDVARRGEVYAVLVPRG